MKKGLRNLLLAGAVSLGLTGASLLPIKAGPYNSPINLFMHPVESAYDSLETKQERDDYVQNFLNENPHDAYHIPGIPGLFDCTEFSNLLSTDGYGIYTNAFHGYSGENLDSIYLHRGTLSRNGTGKIPVLILDVSNFNEFGVLSTSHQMNIIYTGDDLTWESANAVEPQIDVINTQPGSWQMHLNCNLYVSGPPTENLSPVDAPFLIKYEVRNGIVSEPIFEGSFILPEYAKWLTIKERDKNPPENNINFRNDTLEYEVIDANFKSARVSTDNGQTWKYFSSPTGTKKLNLENGYHDIIFESYDEFRHKTVNEENIFVDNKPDEWEEPSSLEKEVLNSDVKVCPNPATDYINFVPKENKESQLRIYSVDGKEIENVYDIDGNMNLDVSSYKPGMYLYKYTNSDGVKSGKVLKK